MPYLDSKIVGFINFFYDEVQKQKLPWTVNVCLYDHYVPRYNTMHLYLYDGITIKIDRTDIELHCTKHFTREQLTWPKSSPEHLAKYAVKKIREEIDRWNSENH